MGYHDALFKLPLYQPYIPYLGRHEVLLISWDPMPYPIPWETMMSYHLISTLSHTLGYNDVLLILDPVPYPIPWDTMTSDVYPGIPWIHYHILYIPWYTAMSYLHQPYVNRISHHGVPCCLIPPWISYCIPYHGGP